MRTEIGNWRRQFALGIEEIDEEYKALVDCLDTLLFSPNTPFSDAEAPAAPEKLTDSAITHFRVEERLMHLLEYSKLEVHMAEHPCFVEQVAQFRMQSLSAGTARSVTAYLTQWLPNHIDRADREYAKHFRQARSLPAAGNIPTTKEAGDA